MRWRKSASEGTADLVSYRARGNDDFALLRTDQDKMKQDLFRCDPELDAFTAITATSRGNSCEISVARKTRAYWSPRVNDARFNDTFEGDNYVRCTERGCIRGFYKRAFENVRGTFVEISRGICQKVSTFHSAFQHRPTRDRITRRSISPQRSKPYC